MPLNFPDKPDIQLANPPLVEVVCQVRFPPILRIADEEPSEFQELIRKQFPQIEVEQGFVLQVSKPIGKVPKLEPQTGIYRFRTQDGQTAISLAIDFYAVSTNSYTHWGEFAQHLSFAHAAIQEVYAPAYATRIGLRYINRFTPANTGYNSAADLFDILRPELAAQSHSEAWSDPLEMRSRLQLTDHEAKFTVNTLYREERGESFLTLDFDYFEEGQLELHDLIERCRRYNKAIYRAFRWCVKDEKLSMFGLKEKEDS